MGRLLGHNLILNTMHVYRHPMASFTKIIRSISNKTIKINTFTV
jgi:hypothetical protein